MKNKLPLPPPLVRRSSATMDISVLDTIENVRVIPTEKTSL
jgi:hypothetical protein